MDRTCIHCFELVEATMARCQACGGDPRVRADVDVIDLRGSEDLERDNADLLASLVAAYSDATPHRRPHWGDNASTPFELELKPVHIGRAGPLAAADVLPTVPHRRTRRRG